MKTPCFLLFVVASLFLIAPEHASAALGTNTDLAIGKTASINLVKVGDVLSFQLSVTNLGPASATAAVVADVLPSGLHYLSAAGAGTYNPTNGQWNFVPGTPGSISLLTITVQATNAGTWLNSAAITASTPADISFINNTSSASVTVSAVTNPPIVLNCPSNLTATATSASGAIVFFTVTASGGCSPPPFVSANPPSGSTFPVGTTTVFTTASDTCGNSTNCSFTVTVVAPPISLNCPSNLTVTATGPGGVVVFFTASATGGCSPPPLVTANPPSGSTFPVGTTTVVTTASDSCGTSNNCSFTVTVKPPVYPPILLNCPSNLTVNASSGSGATVFFTVTASGGCSPPPFVSANPASGSTFPVGTTTVFTTASDTCGNSTNCSFTVTVVKPPISLNCPSNLTVTATGPNGAVVFFTASASGGCSPPPFVNATPASGSTFPIGTTTVLTTASDPCGTSTNCSFTVTVVEPPISLNCSSNLTVTATSSNGMVVFFTVTATGGCSPPPFVTANPPSGSTFPIGTTPVLVTASDSCGGSTNCSFTVTVNPQSFSPIVLNCPSNLTATATSFNGAVVFFTVTASGGCAPLTVVADPPSGSSFGIGLTMVNVTASDGCGNSTNCSFPVTMEPPTCVVSISCPSNLVVTSSVPTAVFFNVTASDSCGASPTVTASPPSGSTFPIGSTTVYCDASDANGRAACSFTVTVVRTNTLILLSCSSNITTTATGSSGATVFYSVTASGGCSPPTVSAYPPSGSTFPVGATTVSVTASDVCGDSTSCSFVVNVVAPPIVLNCSSNITTTAASSSGATVFYSVSASGGCSTPIISAYPPSGSTLPVGATIVNVTASDGCGNSTNCSFVVTVVQSAIALNCPSNITTTATSSGGAVVFFSATASGGCTAPVVSAYPPSGSTFPVGTNIVSVTASDPCGNSANCSFAVIVARPPIVLNCSSNLTRTATSSSGATVFFTVTASGGCSPPIVSAYPPSGSTFPIGVTTVFTTASDACDTYTNCSFTVTVISTNPPSGPRLSIRLSGTNHILLAWPTNTTFTYSLAQILALGGTNWLTLSNQPAVVAGSNQVVLVMSNSQSFFRLTSPASNTSPCLVSLTLTNCGLPESVFLTPPAANPTVNPGSPVNLAATLYLSPGLVAVVSYYTNSAGYSPNCPDTFVTNLVSPTILSNSWIVQGPGSYTASGPGLNAVFTPVGCGNGTVHFITTWQHVCDAGQSSAFASGSFAVNCANTCLVAGVSTNCVVSGSMALTNIAAATNFCFGSAVSASVANLVATNSRIIITTTYTNAAGAVTTNCPPTYVTNAVAPTAISNWWTVSGPGSYTNRGAGLTATFTPTNGGSGQIKFYLTYSNNAPCSTNPVTISTAAWGFNVIQITNLCVAEFPTNQIRTTIGVGEVVELSLARIAAGPYTWSTSAGTVLPTNGTMTTLIAPPRAATATVMLNYPGGSCNLPFTVIEPASESAIIDVTNAYDAGKQGAGMHLVITVAPTTVSFANVELLEVPGPATSVTGYFTNSPAALLVHNANTNWIQLNDTNQWGDSAAFWNNRKPWYPGGFQWVIPVRWRVVGTTNVGNLPNRLQVFSINGTNGSSTVSKLGQSVTRIP